MRNPCIVRSSADFFIAAAILALFGAAALNTGGIHGGLQLLLAVLMGGAGLFLRSGTQDARWFGLAVAVLTVVVGGYVLVSGQGYVPGTIIAMYAIFRLVAVPSVTGPEIPHVPQSPAGPLTAFDAPRYGAPAVPQQQYGAPAVPQQQYGAPQAPQQPDYFGAPTRQDDPA